MKPPARWLEAGSDAPLGAPELLGSAAPPPDFSDAVRQRMGIGVAKTATLPATSAWPAVLMKGALVVGVGVASGLAVHFAEGRSQVAAPAAMAALGPAAVVAASLASAPPALTVEAQPALQLPTAAPDRAPRLKLDPQLEEAELLERARGLVGSNPAAALKLTAEHTQAFPEGRLGAEAELIAAQSLLGLGDAAAAKARARSSLARYPSSLYARQLREILATP